jgi:hypothetical protein
MHLLIPFAACVSEAGRAAAATLELPQLQALLARLAPVQSDPGDEWSFSPPHERALALALGLHGGMGLLPWAARQAQADGVVTGDLAWGLITPVHLHLGTDQVSLADPQALLLDEAGSRIFFDAVRELFTSEGFSLHWAAPLRWYAAHESLAALATASLDRVIGRNIDPWLGSDPAARRIRRLQSEVQMVLHTHPLNAEREAQGLLAVNSFWLSGCGVAQRESGAEPQVDECLRAPALAEDWAGWVRAWEALDAGPISHLVQLLTRSRDAEPLRLTLCGERGWTAFEPATPGLWQRLRGWGRRQPASVVLEPL